MGSISVGTLTLSQQRHINDLLKKEFLYLSEWVINNNQIDIIIDDKISTAVLIKISKLVTNNISLSSEIITNAVNTEDNLHNLLIDWSNIDICNYMLYY